MSLFSDIVVRDNRTTGIDVACNSTHFKSTSGEIWYAVNYPYFDLMARTSHVTLAWGPYTT